MIDKSTRMDFQLTDDNEFRYYGFQLFVFSLTLGGSTSRSDDSVAEWILASVIAAQSVLGWHE